MSTSRNKARTIKDFYMQYPYKINIKVGKNTIPDPYVKKEDIVYNEYSLDFHKWRAIVERYFELMRECLETGDKFKIPHRVGYLQIQKYKFQKHVDRLRSTKEKKIYIYRNGLDNYVLRIIWLRNNKEASMKYKWHWKLKANAKFMRGVYIQCEKDYGKINKFNDK